MTGRAAIVTDFLNSIGSLDFTRARSLLDDDAVMAFPYLDTMPDVHGGDAVIARLSGTIPHAFERMDFHYDAFYEVTDSDTLIAEYRSESPLRGGTGMYRNDYIAVFTFSGDKITLYKEYLNPVNLAAMG